MQRRHFLKKSAYLGMTMLLGNAYAKVNIEPYHKHTPITQIINDPVFAQYGRLLFPVNSNYYSGDTLGNLDLTWYSHINADKNVEIVNYLRNRVINGEQVFFDIYTLAEKKADPTKNNTGLFFFKGKKGEKFAICNAGGGFAYVGAIHDSFPHALELSKKGYNAFALIYRPNAQTAIQDLARSIAFIFENAEKLGVNTQNYSLWGGSAGARMAAILGRYGTATFGEKPYPKPSAVMMQYTGFSEFDAHYPPTYSNVGDNDYIANWKGMQRRADEMRKLGIDTEFQVYQGLGHGFGLGINTKAQGWINNAVRFWEKQKR